MVKVSVLIPSYNNAHFLSELIDSILSQSFQDFEIIICDDCSTDDSVKVVRKYTDPRIRFFRNRKNLGIVANMNRCISLAMGQYIYLIGSDDVMYPTNLEKKVKFLNTHSDVGLVCSNIDIINEEGTRVGGIWSSLPKEDTVFEQKIFFKRLMIEGNFICHPSVLLRKRCHEMQGLYDARFPSCQDYAFWGKLSLHYKLGYIAEPLIGYRWHSNNLTQQYRGDQANRGKSQNALAKLISMKHYHEQGEDFLTKSEIKNIYNYIALSFFWINEYKNAREAFFASFKHSTIQSKNVFYFILSFFPPLWIRHLRHIKEEALS